MVGLRTKSALSYFGSDSEVAESLAGLLDGCRHVTIPFVGGAAILPFLKARAIVANDLNELAINFYRHASGVYGGECQSRLVERCRNTLSHPCEVDEARSRLGEHWRGSWQQAWAYWAACWICRKGKGGTKGKLGKPSVRWTPAGGMNSSRIRAAAEDLRVWVDQFRRCEWLCEDYQRVLAKVSDRKDCGIYCDPPWVDAGDAYLHAFTMEEHRRLASDLHRFEYATVVVRYGDHPVIRELYEDWQVIEAASRTQSNAVKGEVWCLNLEV